MPHSTFKERPTPLNSEVAKCPCGKIFNYASDGGQGLKFQMHCEVCPMPVSSEHIRIPEKELMQREHQHDETERMRRVYENQ